MPTARYYNATQKVCAYGAKTQKNAVKWIVTYNSHKKLLQYTTVSLHIYMWPLDNKISKHSASLHSGTAVYDNCNSYLGTTEALSELQM